MVVLGIKKTNPFQKSVPIRFSAKVFFSNDIFSTLVNNQKYFSIDIIPYKLCTLLI